MLKKIFSFLLLFFIIQTVFIHNSASLLEKNKSKVIVFDIGGVLLLTDSFVSLKKLGITTTLAYAWQQKSWNSDALRLKFFQVLLAIEPFDPKKTYTVKDDHGVLIPPVMLNWLTGTSGSVIKKQIKVFMAQNKSFFKSKQEAELVKNLANMVFEPYNFIKSRKLNSSVVKLLPILAQHKYTILLCSNWDSESFEFCKKKFPEIFNYVDGYIISGQEKCLKPNPEIFQRLIEKYKIDPTQQLCLFIDDQKENRATAKQFGFRTYHPDTFKKIVG